MCLFVSTEYMNVTDRRTDTARWHRRRYYAESLESLGERCKLPQRGLGPSPSQNQIWCFLAIKSDIWWQQFLWFSWESTDQILCTLNSKGNLVTVAITASQQGGSADGLQSTLCSLLDVWLGVAILWSGVEPPDPPPGKYSPA